MEKCDQCPRHCRVARGDGAIGYCAAPEAFSIARIAKHPWEEPCISGSGGSGTIFFCGCNLRCVFCQNREISRRGNGTLQSDDELIDGILRLRDEGAENINLVTPTHYTAGLERVLKKIKPTLGIPVIWNSGGYESVQSLRRMEGLVDVYLPDVKYFDPALSANYSSAPDYFQVALTALAEMLRQVGNPRLDCNGKMIGGVMVRHLVLPGCRKDSVRILTELAERFGNRAFLLSLMSQYTPEFAKDAPYPNLHRRLTTFEYESVLAVAEKLDFQGYRQSLASAVSEYTPDFCNPTGGKIG